MFSETHFSILFSGNLRNFVTRPPFFSSLRTDEAPLHLSRVAQCYVTRFVALIGCRPSCGTCALLQITVWDINTHTPAETEIRQQHFRWVLQNKVLKIAQLYCWIYYIKVMEIYIMLSLHAHNMTTTKWRAICVSKELSWARIPITIMNFLCEEMIQYLDKVFCGFCCMDTNFTIWCLTG